LSHQGAPGFIDFRDAFGNDFPFRVILDVELLTHAVQHALPHLFRIEIALRPILLCLKVAGTHPQRGGDAERADGR